MSEIDVTRIEDALTAHWGERCGEIADDCPVCQAWSELDSLLSERDALQDQVEVMKREWADDLVHAGKTRRDKVIAAYAAGFEACREMAVEKLRAMSARAKSQIAEQCADECADSIVDISPQQKDSSDE